MADVVEKRRVHCARRHVSVFVVRWDNGSFSIKCSLLKACGDSCPYLENPDYKSEFRSSPEYKPG
ncbi:MAG: hypothetical protein HY530_07075 [Chloroflexi bacterium]|nr:hypothetical protein [Chloroflexota bacterium]